MKVAEATEDVKAAAMEVIAAAPVAKLVALKGAVTGVLKKVAAMQGAAAITREG